MAINKKEAYKNITQYHTGIKEGEIGEYIILPGDPFRVDIIAKHLDNPVLIAHQREHKTVTGYYKGLKVSITSTGMGCPSTAIALEELANCGGKVFVRLGTCAGFREDIHPGDICVTQAVIKQDGTSNRYVPVEYPASPDLDLTYLLASTTVELCKDSEYSLKLGYTCSDDAFYSEDENWINKMYDLGIMNVEMESSALFTISSLRNLRAATICAAAANLYLNEEFLDEVNTVTPLAIEKSIDIILETFYRYDNLRKENKLLKPLD